eukprot:363869-Chlamydomonas_euryale.AAC.5
MASIAGITHTDCRGRLQGTLPLHGRVLDCKTLVKHALDLCGLHASAPANARAAAGHMNQGASCGHKGRTRLAEIARRLLPAGTAWFGEVLERICNPGRLHARAPRVPVWLRLDAQALDPLCEIHKVRANAVLRGPQQHRRQPQCIPYTT